MMRSFIRFRFETRTQTELLFEVLEGRWRDADDILQRARRLGIHFNNAQQMIIVDYGGKAHDRKHHTPYLETLTAYLRESCRSQACADAMGSHVTTLRYRLSRIQELFGIDLETPERRFSTELAIHLQRVIDSWEVRASHCFAADLHRLQQPTAKTGRIR
ncbi:helix-turn-helix domain-containing protein [Pseudomonas gingeri]|uniref:PucR family transcriptional regulator n=2 Tax=Pseudomonas gingeri TaxID=117681 RepID=UPI00351C0981